VWGALALVGALAVAAAILAIGVTKGWFDSGSVEGSTVGFEPKQEPKPRFTGSWPDYGYDAQRSRSNTALDLKPPYRRIWRFEAGSLLEFPPVLGRGAAFIGTNRGAAIAIDTLTGREIWRRKLAGRVASSPALAIDGTRKIRARRDLVLFTTTQGFLYALDRTTGGVRWRMRAGSSIESSPLVVDRSAYIGTLDGRVLRISLRDGRRVWAATAAGDVKAGLAVAGKAVVVGDYAGRVSAFARRSGRLLWRRTSPGEALRGAGRFYAGPAVAYGRVYVSNVNGRVLALDRDTGAVAWVRVLHGLVYSSAAVSRRLVYVGSYDRRLHALDAVTGRPRWSADVGERISGSPSVVGRLVYVSTLARGARKGRTFAFDARTGKRVWAFPDGRYTPVTAVTGLLVITGWRTLYGLAPR